MRILAIIPARGGSQRLPRKNVMPLGGVPLIGWTIRTALAAASLDRVVVTTDDEEIAAVARAEGADVPFLRPAHLATATATSLDAVLHAVDATEPEAELVVLLQPTSPFRSVEDIEATVAAVRAGAPAAVSVQTMPRKWDTLLCVDAAGHLFAPTFTGPTPALALNGAVYVVRTEILRAGGKFVPPGTVGHLMPAERSIDIDTIEDFRSAELLLPTLGATVLDATMRRPA